MTFKSLRVVFIKNVLFTVHTEVFLKRGVGVKIAFVSLIKKKTAVSSFRMQIANNKKVYLMS